MKSILARFKKPLSVTHNHLFYFEKNMPLDTPLKTLPERMRLIYPCRFSDLSISMFDGTDNEYNNIRERVNQGDKLGIIVFHGQIVHRSLVQTAGMAAMEADPRAVQLNPGEIYIHWCETPPSFSGLGLYSSMLSRILQYSKTESDFRKAYIACRQDNVASIKGILKAGFRYCRSSKAFSLLGGTMSHSSWYRVPDPPERAPDGGYAI